MIHKEGVQCEDWYGCMATWTPTVLLEPGLDICQYSLGKTLMLS